VFRVIFSGKSGMSKEQVYDFCLLRCSELVKEKGYSYFIMLSGEINASIEINRCSYPVTICCLAQTHAYSASVYVGGRRQLRQR
jgi:hypothetical protein